jgi:glutamate synthase domain-containing protein 2
MPRPLTALRASFPTAASGLVRRASGDFARALGTGRGADFVTVDGGEGGTGAAPLIFTNSVSLPF